jgi:hypothetical protein
MNIWGWTFLLSNVLYWGIFLKVARTGSRRGLPIAIGIIHMLFATLVSVAPLRSFFDPQYLGFGLGLLRFQGRAATLPSSVVLAFALASAWLVVSRSARPGFLLVAMFDLLFAINTAAGILVSSDHRIQFGNALTIDGILAIAIMLSLFAGAPLLSSGWAWRRHQANPA